MTQSVLAEFGIEASGAVMDPRALAGARRRRARLRAAARSCSRRLYEARFGLLRRDLVEWAKDRFEVPVTHIPVRVDDDAVRWDVTHTLVVGTQTIASPDLIDAAQARARPSRRIATRSSARARATSSREDVVERLARTLAELYRADIDATGQPMSPEPFAAIENAIEHYRIDDILISTLAGQQSKWLEEGLIERVEAITDKPVEHYEAGAGSRSRQQAAGRGGVAPNGVGLGSRRPRRASTSTTARPRRIRARGSTARRSGILLFIVSEVMLFGAFFASYFFLRVVSNDGPWPPEGFELPVAVAGVNTAILISSSFTVHWALEATRKGNRRGMQMGLMTTWLLGATFLFIQINEYIHIGFSGRDGAFGSIFYGLTGLHGAHVFVGLLLLTFANIRAWRGHFGRKPKDHLGRRGPGHLLALRRRHVDHRLHRRLHPLRRPISGAWLCPRPACVLARLVLGRLRA